MPRPRTRITITLDPDLYDLALTKATARLLTIDAYLTERVTRALQQEAQKATSTPPVPARAARTVETHFKTPKQQKAT